MYGYSIGDYVVVSHPLPETDYVPGAETFKVVGFTTNAYGSPLVKVADIAYPESTTVFYPRELSFEDGTRPVSAPTN
jgi:hypothetical protein